MKNELQGAANAKEYNTTINICLLHGKLGRPSDLEKDVAGAVDQNVKEKYMYIILQVFLNITSIIIILSTGVDYSSIWYKGWWTYAVGKEYIKGESVLH